MDKELLEAVRGTVKEALREAIDAAESRLHGRPQDTTPPWTKFRTESRLESIERAVSGLSRRLAAAEARIDGLEGDVSETRTAAQELGRRPRKAESNQ